MNPVAYGVAGFLTLLLVGVGVQTFRLSETQGELAEVRLQQANERQAYAEAAKTAADAYRKREGAMQTEVNKAQENADHQTKVAAAGADALADALGRLRNRPRPVTACGGGTPANPATPSASPTASAPTDLPADLPARIGEAAGQLATVAEAALTAGEACAASYDAIAK